MIEFAVITTDSAGTPMQIGTPIIGQCQSDRAFADALIDIAPFVGPEEPIAIRIDDGPEQAI